MRPSAELSVVVLCYRAGEAVVALVERLREALAETNAPFELVLVANYDAGVPDTTPAVAHRLAASRPDIVVVAEVKQGGMGWDLRSGLEAANGEAIAVIDGDGQYEPADVVRAFTVLRETGADVAKGRRTSRSDGLVRKLVTLTYNAAFALLFPRVGVRDVNGKPKAITRAALQQLELRSDDWFLDAELVLEARRLRLRIVEFPVAYLSGSRPSFVKPAAVLEFARHMLRYRLTGRP